MADEDEIVNAETLDGPVNELVPSNRRFTSALASLYLKSGIHRFGARYSYGRETRVNRGVGGLSLAESYDAGAVFSIPFRPGLGAISRAIFSTTFMSGSWRRIAARVN
jgi:hypothetical protein